MTSIFEITDWAHVASFIVWTLAVCALAKAIFGSFPAAELQYRLALRDNPRRQRAIRVGPPGGQLLPHVLDGSGEDVDTVEPFHHLLEPPLRGRLPARDGLDLNLQTPAVGQDAGEVALSGYPEPHHPPAQPGDAHVRPPQPQHGQRAERTEDRVLKLLLRHATALRGQCPNASRKRYADQPSASRRGIVNGLLACSPKI